MRRPSKPVMLTFLALFLLPLAARAALSAFEERPRSWHLADWSSIGSLPPAAAHPEARVLVLSARTGRLEGHLRDPQLGRAQARERALVEPLRRGRLGHAGAHQRLGAGRPLVRRQPGGDRRRRAAAEAEALIPKIEAAITAYGFAKAGDYRVWPGPNSNTFVATVLRAVPELGVALPPTAIGKDFRDGPFVGLTDSRTGIEASLWGLLGVKLGWVEGVELNVLGLVAGLDLRQPALKLPGVGRLGFSGATAVAATPRQQAN